jgi:hypothetical protein
MNEAIFDRGVISHMEKGVISDGILNVECEVLPPFNNNAAVPLAATAMAISPSRRMESKRALNTNVFPVPPGPSIKKILDFGDDRCTSSRELSSTVSNTSFWSMLKGSTLDQVIVKPLHTTDYAFARMWTHWHY